MVRPGPHAAAPDAGGLALEHVSAAVLCGGRSRRFGSDKALVRLGGRSLLERVLVSLAPARERLLIGHAYAVADARHVPDRRPGQGPLAGLETALENAVGPWVAIAACDLPCLTPTFWRLLCAHAGSAADAVAVLDAAGRFEPLAALYHRSALAPVRDRLDAGERDLQGLLRGLRTVAVPAARVHQACGGSVLRNVNRPQDMTEDDMAEEDIVEDDIIESTDPCSD